MERKKHSRPPKKKAHREQPRLHKAHDLPMNVPLEFVSEQFNRLVQKILQEKHFDNIDDANKFLAEEVSPMPYEKLREKVGEDPVEQAQELAYQAIGADTLEEALSLARRALELDPDCIDAQTIEAMATSPTPEVGIEKIRDVIRRAEERFGPEFMREAEGQFWSILETRPYMRARERLMEIMLYLEREEEAIAELEALLRLNPGDNQGFRYMLLSLYLQHGRVVAARRLLDQYPDEASAVFNWGRVLQRLLAGDTAGAEESFHDAMGANRYFFEFMTGRRKLPKHEPETYGFGDEDEGLYCVRLLGPAWLSHPQAMNWLVYPQGHRKAA